MESFYTSDWHIHTEASFDSEMQIGEILCGAQKNGITQFGISDHVNFPFMLPHLEKSRKLYLANKKDGFHFGVELTTLPLSQYVFACKNRKADCENNKTWFKGYAAPLRDKIALSLDEETLCAYGVEYVIGGAHWAFTDFFHWPTVRNAIHSYHAQQMFLATDKRVDIIAHPWWIYQKKWEKDGVMTGPWYDDFARIPRAMHEEFAAAVLENGKYVELNTDFFVSPLYTEKFRVQYAAYICFLYERGIPVTIGSDLHSRYTAHHAALKKYFAPLGFSAESFSVPKFRTHTF